MQNKKSPSLYKSKSLKVLLDLHVDDGYASGPEESLEKVFSYLATVLVIKVSPLVKSGMAFDHVGTTRYRTDEGMWIQTHEKYVTKVLEMMSMSTCNASTSPKLDKATMDDDEVPCEKPALFRTAVCTLLYASKRKPEIQSTVRWLCKRLKAPDQKAWRQLVKLCRYMKGSQGLATFFPRHGEASHIVAYLDGDWACDELDRKSVAGGCIMVGGCRMHSHSRGLIDHALSSGESEIMSASEMLKECLLLQYNLQEAGFGLLRIVMHTDATVCRQFVHRKGVGRMKHLETRHMWLQEKLEKNAYSMKKIPRDVNPSDMMTHAPTAAELQKFLPMIGIYERACADGAGALVKTALVLRPSSGVKLAAAVWAYLTGLGRSSEVCSAAILVKENNETDSSLRLVMILVVVCLLVGFVFGWIVRAKYDEKKQVATVAVVVPVAPVAAVQTTKSTQSQTRYTYWTVNPRFVPLGDREHGCWELAR